MVLLLPLMLLAMADDESDMFCRIEMADIVVVRRCKWACKSDVPETDHRGDPAKNK